MLHAAIIQYLVDTRLWNICQVGIKAGQHLVEQPFAEGNRLGMALMLEEVTDVAACLTGDDEAQPGWIGTGARGGNDFDGLAALQWLR